MESTCVTSPTVVRGGELQLTPEKAAEYLRLLGNQFGRIGKADDANVLQLIAGMVLEQQRIINELRANEQRRETPGKVG